jgi:FkbM family methyltransferase
MAELFARIPSRRALAAVAKVRGLRLERRWPFVTRAEGRALNLGFDDLLELQWARSRDFVIVVVGAYDGIENDPISRFARSHRCRGVLLEPQPAVYERLCANLVAFPSLACLNAAIDERSGERTMYSVRPGSGLPEWTEQIASFRREHVEKHEERAPGLGEHIVQQPIPTISFADLIEKYGMRHIDVLQIDAEGMDAQLLQWFPFERLRPGLLHYEVAHMKADEERSVRERLGKFGYRVFMADAPTDAMAVRV